MPKVTVYNQDGATIGSQDLSDKVFGVKPKAAVIHQVVTSMMANRRQVLAHTKDRGDVRGGGKKPWKQKGTGRARHGSTRSPLWVGGGVTFGPTKERNFKQKINDKVRRQAITMCLSDRVADNKLVLLDKIEIEAAKTKNMASLINGFRKILYGDEINVNKTNHQETEKPEGANNEKKSKKARPKKILFLIPSRDEKIQRSCRNLPWLKCMLSNNANVIDILAYEYMFTSVAGVKKLEETFGKQRSLKKI